MTIFFGFRRSRMPMMLCRKVVVARVALGNERAQLDVLDGHLLTADAARENTLQLVVAGVVAQGGYLLHLLLVEVLVQPLKHAVEGYFGRVGDEGENSVFDVVVDGLQDAGHQLLAQQLALAVNVHVAAAAEVDALEGAGTQLARLVDLHRAQASRLADEDGLSRLQFANAGSRRCPSGRTSRSLRPNPYLRYAARWPNRHVLRYSG